MGFQRRRGFMLGHTSDTVAILGVTMLLLVAGWERNLKR